MVHRFGLLVFVLFFACAGCGSNAKSVSSSESAKSRKENLATVQGAATSDVTRLSLSKQNEIIPDSETWQSEQATEKIQKQLKLLAKSFEQQDDSSSLNIVAADFQCTLPRQLVSVFDDGNISVERTQSTHSSAPSRQGDFSELRSHLFDQSGSRIRCELKVFHIDQESDIRTTVRCRISFHLADGRVQNSSIWRCQWTRDAVPKMIRVEIVDEERVVTTSGKSSPFSDSTAAVFAGCNSYQQQLVHGLDHWLDRLELYFGIAATSYHGLSVADVNGDGLDDLYLCQPGGTRGGLPNRLYLQRPDGTVRDASVDSGLDWLAETHCGLFVDFDNDGDQDLVASTMAGLYFAENDGNAHFQIRAYKLTPDSPAISLAAADFDDDGDIDVYAGCYGRRASGEIMGRPVPYHDANNGSRNVMYRNDQNWTFRDVTKSIGLNENNRRFSLACSFEDFDNDGDQDLYVANDFGRNNLYQNDSGRFRDVAAEWNVEDMSAGMSVSWGDYDNNGRMDLYVSNMWSSAGNRTTFQREFLDGNEHESVLEKFRRHARGNSLFSNSGGTTFQDVSLASGVFMAGWAWSSRFVDLNNDGREDLVVANGYISQENTDDL